MVRWTTKLNTPGIALSAMPEVHAMTDVTGFGLAGHLLEICRGSSLSAQVEFDAVPVIPLAAEIAQSGTATGASARNWDGYGSSMVLPDGFAKWKQNLLSDPQTSGGLLIACAPEAAQRVLEILRAEDFGAASIIGSLSTGAAQVQVD
jgi:selenide,water dikinase